MRISCLFGSVAMAVYAVLHMLCMMDVHEEGACTCASIIPRVRSTVLLCWLPGVLFAHVKLWAACG